MYTCTTDHRPSLPDHPSPLLYQSFDRAAQNFANRAPRVFVEQVDHYSTSMTSHNRSLSDMWYEITEESE
jgi:hypothetical protein